MNASAAFPGFSSDGVAVWDRFLSVAQTRELRDCALRRRARGDFTAARIGTDLNLQRREEVRGDSTCWLGEPLTTVERSFMEGVERLRLGLNRECYLGLLDVELHYACYAPGTGYARHLDQLRGRAQRKVSLIVYLNDAWEAGDGGELRLFGADDRHRDVEPRSGRLVCFLTEAREHSVLTTHVERFSVSGWFSGRA